MPNKSYAYDRDMTAEFARTNAETTRAAQRTMADYKKLREAVHNFFFGTEKNRDYVIELLNVLMEQEAND